MGDLKQKNGTANMCKSLKRSKRNHKKIAESEKQN